jgi:ferredoxin-NADP reductase/nitrite reductase/ring-hydroxylating ferredoxin subunit
MATEAAWHPIASSEDLPPRHTFHARLLGQDLAVWRADDGYVNVWIDRCLHRGVRLSIGLNDGAELKCQYHGWRYASRSGGCTYIPAHPGDAPASTLCAGVVASVEQDGLVWASLAPDGSPPRVVCGGGEQLVLRPVHVRAPAERVRRLLSDDDAVFLVQPVDSTSCVMRGVVARPAAGDTLAVLRRHNDVLSRLRDRAEGETAEVPADEPVEVRVAPRPAPASTIDVVVTRRADVATGVVALELAPVEGMLPAFQPGAHIDVHLGDDLVRQYSLVNGPEQVATYTIGVKLEPDSQGGSKRIHSEVEVGHRLAISAPRNNFPLRRDKPHTLLIAGGIGITPLLSMAQALHHVGLGFTLHCFAQSDDHLAFQDELSRLGDSVQPHLGLSPADTGLALREILHTPDADAQVYVCGPGPMLDAARTIAAESGWPDEQVHFEYFKNTNVLDASSAFTLVLARSGTKIDVAPGESALDALEAHGVHVVSSCRQGACGTCLVHVLDGEPEHQDVYLNATERARNDRMLVCVSRARSDRVVVDL